MKHYCIMLTKDKVRYDDLGGKEERWKKNKKTRKETERKEKKKKE